MFWISTVLKMVYIVFLLTPLEEWRNFHLNKLEMPNLRVMLNFVKCFRKAFDPFFSTFNVVNFDTTNMNSFGRVDLKFG